MVDEKKTPPPFVRTTITSIVFQPEEVARIIRDHTRSLNLRGYPESDLNVKLIADKPSYEDSLTCIGRIEIEYQED